jgi:hypothetical protein
MSRQTRLLALLAPAAVLAVVTLVGWPASRQMATARAQAGTKKEAIVFTVRLPADAVLLIDDHKTSETGAVRTFRTPPLPAGGTTRTP